MIQASPKKQYLILLQHSSLFVSFSPFSALLLQTRGAESSSGICVRVNHEQCEGQLGAAAA